MTERVIGRTNPKMSTCCQGRCKDATERLDLRNQRGIFLRTSGVAEAESECAGDVVGVEDAVDDRLRSPPGQRHSAQAEQAVLAVLYISGSRSISTDFLGGFFLVWFEFWIGFG